MNIDHISRCPECFSPLAKTVERGVDVCPQRHGSLFEGNVSKPLIVDDTNTTVEMLAQLLANPGERERECPSCKESMRQISIKKVDLDLCGRCGSAWIGEGDVLRMTSGHRADPVPLSGEPAPHAPSPTLPPVADGLALASRPNAAAPPSATKSERKGAAIPAAAAPSKSRSAPILLIAAAVIAATIAGGLVIFFVVTDKETEKTVAKTPLELYEQYGAYFVNVPFGGQTIPWWRERLQSLSPNGKLANADLFALTQKRAKQAGLDVITEQGLLDVRPEDRMKIALVKRMKLDQ